MVPGLIKRLAARRASLKELVVELRAVFRILGVVGGTEYVMQLVLNIKAVLASSSLQTVDIAMDNRRRTYLACGRKITLESGAFGCAREIYGRGVYFAAPEFSLSPTDVVVDLGANAGAFTVLAAILARQVIAVEAQTGFVEQIHANTAANRCSEKVAVMLGLVGGTAGLFADRTLLRAASRFCIDPPELSMDKIIEAHDLEQIDFLKIDIEGSEFGLFQGELSWLWRVRRIAMEVHCAFGNPLSLAQRLRENCFDVSILDNRGRRVERLTEMSGYIFATQGSDHT
jgi:FkbM family methyltransferase